MPRVEADMGRSEIVKIDEQGFMIVDAFADNNLEIGRLKISIGSESYTHTLSLLSRL